MSNYEIPTQTEFNEVHKWPREYGEDGNIAVGNNYTQSEAFEQFRQYWIDTDGEVPDWLKIEDVVLMNFAWGKNPDYAGEPDLEMDYILLNGESERKARFTGWVLEV